MPDIIQLGLSDAITQAAKNNDLIADALPSNGGSVVANREGVTAIVGVDVGKRVTVGAWVSEKWKRAADWGFAGRFKF